MKQVLSLFPLYRLVEIFGRSHIKISCQTLSKWVLTLGSALAPIYDVMKVRVLDSGVLHSDKYGAYEKLAGGGEITWCPCMAHVRRKFVEAEGGDPGLRSRILRKIRYLFMLERVAWRRSPEEWLRIMRHPARQIRPLLPDNWLAARKSDASARKFKDVLRLTVTV